MIIIGGVAEDTACVVVHEDRLTSTALGTIF